MKKTTQIIHSDYRPPIGYEAVQTGVFKASTIIFPDTASMRARYGDELGQQYTYGTKGTPTTFVLEEQLCALENGRYCCLVPSGLAAIALVNLALLKAGDEVLIPSNAYGPGITLAQSELSHFGISYQLYDALTPSDLAAKINDKTRLVWLEAPGSVTMEFPDLIKLVRICKSRSVRTALDNTWGAGLAFNPFELNQEDTGEAVCGVDITVHALTKYPSGGADVLMGSVVTRDDGLHALIKRCHMRLGYSVGLNDVESVLRSLHSLPLRYAAHDQTARTLALWCQSQSPVMQVLHPALEGSPGHSHWKSLCTPHKGSGSAAGLFSIILDKRLTHSQVDAFCDALRLFKLGYSWGGPISLVMPYHLRGMREGQWPQHLKEGHLVRFSIGLEDVQDLQMDLDQAFRQTLAISA
ncbi:MAG TPA: PLP-dependent transferase [Burkholderiaceae bacterium]|nr:PLP-dependent transferase [Burkholderiaceae bacterium]